MESGYRNCLENLQASKVQMFQGKTRINSHITKKRNSIAGLYEKAIFISLQ